MRILFIILLLQSCSNLSNNIVKEGDFSLTGGFHGEKKWNSTLVFNRYSWFHELTLYYDVMIADIDNSSPFYNWFSASEKRIISACKKKKIVMAYELDSRRVSHFMFEDEVKKVGFDKILTPNFEKSLNLHPDHERQSLQLYKSYVLCGSKDVEKAQVSFPSFKAVNVR